MAIQMVLSLFINTNKYHWIILTNLPDNDFNEYITLWSISNEHMLKKSKVYSYTMSMLNIKICYLSQLVILGL